MAGGTRVKICGLMRKDDVAAAVAAGAWAVGFVCWPGSPRAITQAQLRELAAEVPSSVRRVAVVVNASIDEVVRLRDEAGLSTVQLHGEEDPLKFLSLGLEVIKAVSLDSDAAVEHAAALPAEVVVLVDAHDLARRGGTGQHADWERAAELAARRPIILAGGLRPDNIRQALEQVSPWAVDVSSGVESSPGIKDLALISAFMQNAQ
jgi:phosphoribosylanthranilate isomerase